MSNPWLNRGSRYIPKETEEDREKKRREAAAKALAEQEYNSKKSKGKFNFFKEAVGATIGTTKDLAEATGKGTMKGLETFGNQVQSVPAYLFTEGDVQDGEYTTKRNLIGNPLSNIESHVKAQRAAGLVDEDANPFFESIRTANRAGRAFSEDPDISPGVKFATGVAFDPTTYSPAVLAKLPKVGTAVAKSRTLRGVDNILTGFGDPRTAAKFIAGGAVGTELASRTGLPGVPEGLEQFVGGAAGGGFAANFRASRPAPEGLTRTIDPGELTFHGTQNEIQGPLRGSKGGEGHTAGWGGHDLGDGFYTTDSYELASKFARSGDELGNVYGFTPSRSVRMLASKEPLTPDEWARLRPAVIEAGIDPQYWDVTVQRGKAPGLTADVVASALRRAFGETNGLPDPRTREVFANAGWDGFVDDMAPGAQMVFWNPNRVLTAMGKAQDPGTFVPAGMGTDERRKLHEAREAQRRPKLEPRPKGLRSVASSARGKVSKVLENLVLGGDTPTAQVIDGSFQSGRYIDPEVGKLKEELRELRRIADNVPPSRPLEDVEAIKKLTSRLEELGEKDDGFPSRAELLAELKAIEAREQQFEPETPEWEVDAERWREIRNQLDNYDNLKRIHDGAAAARGDLDLGRGLADEPPVGTQIGSISPEEAKGYQANPYTGAGDNAILDDYLTVQDALDSGIAGTSEYLTRSKDFANLRAEMDRRGLTVEQAVERRNSLKRKGEDSVYGEPGVPEKSHLEDLQDELRVLRKLEAEGNISDYGKKNIVEIEQEIARLERPSQPITPPRELEDIPTETLRQRLAAIDTAPLSDFEKKLLKSTMEKELTVRGLAEGGSANPERLTINEVTPGLTRGERIGNRFTELKKLILGFGVKNDERATPIVKEAIRLESVVRTAGARISRQIAHAERLLGADENGLVNGKSVVELADESFEGPITDRASIPPTRAEKYTLEQKRVLEAIRRSSEQIGDLRRQFGVEISEEYIDKLRDSKSAQEYFNRLSSRVGQAFIKSEVDKLTQKKVSLAGAVEEAPELPKEFTDVINRHLNKVKGLNTTESSQIYTTVNNTLRALWATADFSRIFIQDLPMYADLALSNPKLAAKILSLQVQTIWDKDVVARLIDKIDEANYGTGRPTSTDWINSGLHLATISGNSFEEGIVTRLERVPILGHTNRAFTDGGDINRLMQAQNIYEQWKSGNKLSFLGGKNLTEAQAREQIARAVNRSSGWAEKAFGGDVGRATLFAPRFFQSQLESITKAVSDGGLEGDIARRQLIKVIGTGIAFTVLANGVREEDTEFRPWESNFLRIRNVKGNDISLFGPWDSLVRGIVRASPTIDEEGNINFGDPTYLVRSKLSPILSSSVDILVGENVIGEPSNTLESRVKNTVLPFGIRDAINFNKKTGVGLDKNPLAIGLAGVGLKSSPLTEEENLDNRLSEAGILKSDPDYNIKKKEFLAANPDKAPKAERGDYKKSQEVQENITARRAKNEELTKSDGQSLVEFRDNRSKLLAEQRAKRDVIIKNGKRKTNTTQDKWLDSYFKLFDQAKSEIANEIDPLKFDPLVAKWITENGPQALDYVNRYLGTGLGEVETAYYNDIQTLAKDGYFDMPKYINMKSGLSDNQIEKLNQRVVAKRLEDPALQEEPFATTAKALLTELTPAQLTDVINSNKTDFQSPELQAYKDSHRKELMWFNSRALWSTYNNTKNKTGNSSNRVGRAITTSSSRRRRGSRRGLR